MTAPTLTYGHGFLEENWKTLTTNYTLTNGGSTATATVNTTRDLEIAISAFVGDAYLSNNTSLNLSTTLYKKILIRYRTTGNTTAKITAVFSDTTTQTILSETASSSWATVTATLTPTKTLSTIKLYACDGVGTAQYDFCLICKNTFTFPQYSRINWGMRNRYNNTDVPNRLGRRKSWLGADETVIVIDGDVDHTRSEWSRTGDAVAAQVLNDIHHNAATEPWQWFTSDRGSFKVVMEDLNITEEASQNYLYAFNVMLSEYSKTNLAAFSLQERFKL